MPEALIDKKFGIIIPAVSVADFVARYGTVEALEISQLHDPNATTIDENRIEVALYDAQCWLHSYLLAMEALGRELIAPSATRFICAGARYLLDTLRRREVVIQEWDAVTREINRFAQESTRLSKWRNNNNGSTIRVGHARRPMYTQPQMQEFRQLGDGYGEYQNYPALTDSYGVEAFGNGGSNNSDDDCQQIKV